MLIPTLAGCSGKTPAATSDTGTGTVTATSPITDPTAPDAATLLSENRYAAASLEQVELLIQKYYNKRTHTVKTSLTDSHPSLFAHPGKEGSNLFPLSPFSFLFPFGKRFPVYDSPGAVPLLKKGIL